MPSPAKKRLKQTQLSFGKTAINAPHQLCSLATVAIYQHTSIVPGDSAGHSSVTSGNTIPDQLPSASPLTIDQHTSIVYGDSPEHSSQSSMTSANAIPD